LKSRHRPTKPARHKSRAGSVSCDRGYQTLAEIPARRRLRPPHGSALHVPEEPSTACVRATCARNGRPVARRLVLADCWLRGGIANYLCSGSRSSFSEYFRFLSSIASRKQRAAVAYVRLARSSALRRLSIRRKSTASNTSSGSGSVKPSTRPHTKLIRTRCRALRQCNRTEKEAPVGSAVTLPAARTCSRR
jgi:hypothetical protein